MLELVIGGARTGKSRYAQQCAEAAGLKRLYLATARAGDDEMRARIEHHREQRGAGWTTVEEPHCLADVLTTLHDQHSVIVVDCLTLWVTNCLLEGCWKIQKEALIDLLPQLNGHIIFVSNETGMGVVPLGELSRRFVDESGLLHQALAAACDRVTLMVAGLPVLVKPQTSSNSL
jgi:adenosylcobinamide kinase/adenosylcobinamide-phosphate guanylyltransferase